MFKWLLALFSSKTKGRAPPPLTLEPCPFDYFPRPIAGSYTYLREETYKGSSWLVAFDESASRISKHYPQVRLRYSIFKGVTRCWIVLKYDPDNVTELETELGDTMKYCIAIATINKRRTTV